MPQPILAEMNRKLEGDDETAEPLEEEEGDHPDRQPTNAKVGSTVNRTVPVERPDESGGDQQVA